MGRMESHPHPIDGDGDKVGEDGGGDGYRDEVGNGDGDKVGGYGDEDKVCGDGDDNLTTDRDGMGMGVRIWTQGWGWKIAPMLTSTSEGLIVLMNDQWFIENMNVIFVLK